MQRELIKILGEWPKGYIHDADLAIHLAGSDNARYSTVKRALKTGLLVRVRRGLYLIGSPLQKPMPDLFELALQLCSPSYISLQTALAFHGWIPEATYAVTSVTPKRTRAYATPLGRFSYDHTPIQNFYEGVERAKEPVFFMATPWKAIADLSYTQKREWDGLSEFIEDLRIDEDELNMSGIAFLQQLSEEYRSFRVRRQLKRFVKELSNGR